MRLARARYGDRVVLARLEGDIAVALCGYALKFTVVHCAGQTAY
jgi:hypothetical protein